MLAQCTGADQYTRFCAVLTAYAESDFNEDAIQHGTTVGVYQQNPQYWSSAQLGTVAQCQAFLADFESNSHLHTGDPVHDCWLTQRWLVPNGAWPIPGDGFADAPETANYADRVGLVAGIISRRTLNPPN